ncbi:MAG: hypothetical protein QOK29_4346 [Rhodospirillaceae bacterium]|jgi:hypothetical protein|nr:hypothetical protein [Rhodospirillaceae bacterium]
MNFLKTAIRWPPVVRLHPDRADGSAGCNAQATARVQGAWIFGAAFLNVLLFFRYSIFSGFSRISGNAGDSRLAMAQLEHWRHVWSLDAAWHSPIYFHPVKAALGYGDAYFLYGAFYSLFRAVGADWFAAYDLTNIVVKLIGFFSFFYLARKILKVRFSYALLGTSVFFQLNSTAEHILHSQLLTVALVPLQLILVHHFAQAVLDRSRRRLLIFGSAAIALYAAWLMTAYYMAWFLALFALTASVWYLRIAGSESRRQMLLAIKDSRRLLIALAILGAVFLLPFIVTYLPTALATGMYGHAEMVTNSGTPLDIINVGPRNVMYGSLLDRMLVLVAGYPFPGYERTTGFTPALLLLFLLGFIHCWRRPIGMDRRIVHAMLGATVLLWIASLRFGHTHLFLWQIVYYCIPGAKAMRVPPRLQIFIGFFVVLVAMILLDRKRWFDRPLPFAVLAMVLIAEQLNLSGGRGMTRDRENWAFTSVPAPPAECRSFFVLREAERPGAKTPDESTRNIDGMVVAERFNLPTLNGMASFFPPHWDLWRPLRSDYLDRVLAYARAQGVTDGLCSLDIPAGRWALIVPR